MNQLLVVKVVFQKLVQKILVLLFVNNALQEVIVLKKQQQILKLLNVVQVLFVMQEQMKYHIIQLILVQQVSIVLQEPLQVLNVIKELIILTQEKVMYQHA